MHPVVELDASFRIHVRFRDETGLIPDHVWVFKVLSKFETLENIEVILCMLKIKQKQKIKHQLYQFYLFIENTIYSFNSMHSLRCEISSRFNNYAQNLSEKFKLLVFQVRVAFLGVGCPRFQGFRPDKLLFALLHPESPLKSFRSSRT